MKNTARITIPASPKFLTVVRNAAQKVAEISGMEEKEAAEIKLAVDEACSNAIKHACHNDPDHELVLEIGFTDDEFRVVIDDTGDRTDPALVRGRALDEVRPGGLGVHFIRKAFDRMEFDEGKKDGNRLILVKYLGESGKSGKSERDDKRSKQ
jgi:anti-sigma regulatory factor (Ser/Thr protein kinase)